MPADRLPLHLPPTDLLACPKCGATSDTELDTHDQQCRGCGLTFFDLAGMPCWFREGVQQKRIWQNLFGLTLAQSKANLEVAEMELQQCDLLPQVRERLEHTYGANERIIDAFVELMEDAGLEPILVAELGHQDPGAMLQYFELLMRDWAWDTIADEGESDNAAELRRVSHALKTTGLNEQSNVLVIGAGAGRLSYDIHTQFKPRCTLALDNNPLLINAAHRLVTLQKTWLLPEIQANPQDGYSAIKDWLLQVPPTEADHSQWYAVAADAWHPPLKTGCFDIVVTPWFIDVNGREVRDVIAQVSRLLKPGGHWVNTGPLLYSKHQPLSQQYSHDEIRTLLHLAGFTMKSDTTETTTYLKTPLAAQVRQEQMWTFAAQSPLLAAVQSADDGGLPSWIILPHLPIPVFDNPQAQEHPVLAHVLSLVDGNRSIFDLAALMAPNLGPNEDPVAMMKSVFVQYLLVH